MKRSGRGQTGWGGGGEYISGAVVFGEKSVNGTNILSS